MILIIAQSFKLSLSGQSCGIDDALLTPVWTPQDMHDKTMS